MHAAKTVLRSARALLAVCLLSGVSTSGAGQAPAAASSVRLNPRTLAALGRVDERFQSYNVEMAEVVGGSFWKPFAQIKADEAAAVARGETPRTNAAGNMAPRGPIDLGSRRLRVLAAALGPAYMRVSGSWANNVYFQNDDEPRLAKAPPGFQNVLTRAAWRSVSDFTRAVDAKLVTSFAFNGAVRDATGLWTPVQARQLVDFMRSIGGEIYAAELGNEPNYLSRSRGTEKYDGVKFARDSAAFRSFVAQAVPGMKIQGPGDTTVGTQVDAAGAEEWLAGEPQPRFDIISYHYYNGVSERCARPNEPMGISVDQVLTEAFLAVTDQAFEMRKALRDRYAPGAPIWSNEGAGAACGGAPWSATFLDMFRYLDQMGRLAKRGISAIFHNTLAASDYGLIDQTTYEPRPNYWAALLWRRLMGTVVLDAGEIRPGFHVYAHCLRGHPGGVSVLAINHGDAPAAFDAPQAAELYILTAPTAQSASVQLNGTTLAMGSNDTLPKLVPKRMSRASVTLQPRSIGFIALPGAGNPSCRQPGS